MEPNYNSGKEDCKICYGEGIIWNNADPTSGMWCECECVECEELNKKMEEKGNESFNKIV